MVKWFLLCVLLLPVAVAASEKPPLRDPLRPLVAAPQSAGPVVKKQVAPAKQSWQLDGVLLGSERSVALINGQPRRVGERVGAYRVVQIAADRVLLQKGNRKLVLRRSGTGLKKAPSRATEGSQP